jgi:predicted AlkP superfamily pyrophosphatase or phosphodiesterase
MVSKKVLLLVIDALASEVFFPALAEDKLPNFQKLVEAGQVDQQSTAVFPSITHCALSSLATGAYPNKHGVPGGYWFDVDGEHVVYYIGDFWTILKEGIGEFFTDLLFRLNQDRVKEPTCFELVERAGKRAACINHLVHRGDVVHPVNAPLLARLLPGVRNIENVTGPALLFLGDLVHSELPEGKAPFTNQAGLLRRYGLDDENSSNVLLHLAREGALPDFTVAYFMDNDYRSHEVGPQKALPVLEALDQCLGEFFEHFGGVEAFLAEFSVVITGDHSQSNVAEDEEAAVIHLETLLEGFNLSALGQHWRDARDVVACPNMRALQLYFAQPQQVDFEAVAQQLLADARVDQVMWQAQWQQAAGAEGEKTPDGAAQRGYIVLTKNRGRLRFWPSNEIAWRTPNHARDQWGQRWQWEGDLPAVDAECYRRKLRFGDYPNAFERIACALVSANGGHMWATAAPGAEFRLESSLVHVGGGSHGSLHRLDSTMPLVVAGAARRFTLPERTRTVDVLPICLELLGISSSYKAGISHISSAMLSTSPIEGSI